MDIESTEVTHTLTVMSIKENQRSTLDYVELLLEAAELPAQDIDVKAFDDDLIEISAKLVALSVDGSELERISKKLLQKPFITQAYWSSSTLG